MKFLQELLKGLNEEVNPEAAKAAKDENVAGKMLAKNPFGKAKAKKPFKVKKPFQ